MTVRRAPEAEVLRRLVDNPEEAREVDTSNGKIPLHVATSKELASKLLEAYPDGARTKDQAGRLALHYAVEEGRTPETIWTIMAAYPDGTKERDRKGLLAIQVAVQKKRSQATIEVLLSLEQSHETAADAINAASGQGLAAYTLAQWALVAFNGVHGPVPANAFA
eukprot:423857-Prymnesium_polylepis.2